jgi:hypothetical protein
MASLHGIAAVLNLSALLLANEPRGWRAVPAVGLAFSAGMFVAFAIIPQVQEQ